MLNTSWADQQTHAAHMYRTNTKKQTVYFNPALLWKTICSGTGIQEGAKETAKDNFYPAFDAPYETGVYFRSTIERLGDASALIREVLNFLGLPQSSSPLSFVKKILFPYMTRHGLHAQYLFHDNEHWQTPFMSSSVHNSARRMFRWGLLPTMNQHLDPDNSKITGVEAFLGMSVEWLVISQALYTKEWTSALPRVQNPQDPAGSSAPSLESEREGKAICHLRNMAHCADEIIAMTIHMHIDIASLPVMCCERNSHSLRTLRLHGQNSDLKASKTCVHIFFDQRLHVDVRLAAHRSLQTLCSQVRACDNHGVMHNMHLELVQPVVDDVNVVSKFTNEHCNELTDPQRRLVYTEIYKQLSKHGRPAFGAFLPFAPESCYHMSTWMELIKASYRAVILKRDCSDESVWNNLKHSQHNLFMLAFFLYGASVRTEIVRFVDCAITEKSVEQEIPCVTWKRGFIFTIKIIDGIVHIIPTQPTHNVWATCRALRDVQDSEQLPCVSALDLTQDCDDKPWSFPVTKLSQFFSHGLSVLENQTHLDIHNEFMEQNIYHKEPAAMYPMIMWPQFVWLSREVHAMRGDNGSLYAVLDAHSEFTNMHGDSSFYFFQPPEVQLFLAMCGIDRAASETSCVHILTARHIFEQYCLENGEAQEELCQAFFSNNNAPIKVWLETTGSLYYFTSKSHFQYKMQGYMKSAGIGAALEDYLDADRIMPQKVLRDVKYIGSTGGVLMTEQAYGMNLYQVYKNEAGAYRIEDPVYDIDRIEQISECLEDAKMKYSAARSEVESLQARVQDATNRCEINEIARYSEEPQQWKDKLILAEANLNRRQKELDAAEAAKISTEISIKEARYVEIDSELVPWAGVRDDSVPSHSVGMIQSHNADENIWLKDGQYKVAFIHQQLFQKVTSGALFMDFMSASSCLMVEGQRLFLYVDQSMYNEMRKLRPNIKLGEGKTMPSVRPVYLEAFYVIKDACLSDSFQDQQITVACKMSRLRQEQGDSVVFTLPLFNSMRRYQANVVLTPPVGACVHKEVCFVESSGQNIVE